MTNTQLQLALAKMLPEKLCIRGHPDATWIVWNYLNDDGSEDDVKSTEWEHIVRLVEENLTEDERDTFMRHIYIDLDVEGTDTGDTYLDYKMLHASWQQRATAILKVKGEL